MIKLWRSLDPNMHLLVVLNFVMAASVSMYASLLVPWYISLGHGSGAVGTLSSIMQVVSAMAAVVGGVLADQYGRRGLFLLGQVLRCVAVAILFIARSFMGLVVLSVMRGMASVLSPAQSALTAEYTDEDSRATAIGLSLAAMYLGAVIAPAVAGALADRRGAKVPFVIALVLAVLSWVLTIPLKEKVSADRSPPAAELLRTVQGRRTRDPGTWTTAAAPHPSHSMSSSLRRIFGGRRGRHAALVLASTGTNGILNGAFGVLLPLFIIAEFKAGFSQVSLISTFVSLGSVVVQVLGGRVADQLGRRRVILGTGVASLAVVALMPYAGSLLKIYLLLFLASTVANAAGPALSAVLVEVVHEEDRATFSGATTGVTAAGMGLGAWAAGLWYGAGFAVSWFGLIVAPSLASLVAFHFGLPRDGKRTAEGRDRERNRA